jgi:hypothetical protein
MFVVKLFKVDPSSFKIKGCEVNLFNTLEESKRFIIEKHWLLDYDNYNTDLELGEFLEKNTFESLKDKFYDTFEFEIEEHDYIK